MANFCLLHLYRTVYKNFMEERLKLFLAMEGLSPSQFADKLGVQRSGVSHLLSGRNKPSFEFINKMLVAFPKINPDWLITGNGKAYRDFPASAQAPAAEQQPEPQQFPPREDGDLPLWPGQEQPTASPTLNASLEESVATSNEPSLFSMSQRTPAAPVQPQNAPQMAPLSPSAAPNAPAPAQPIQTQQPVIPQPVAQPAPQKNPAENRVKAHTVVPAQGKRIAQITILYTDGTYEVR